jgi:hypothetical protein
LLKLIIKHLKLNFNYVQESIKNEVAFRNN